MLSRRPPRRGAEWGEKACLYFYRHEFEGEFLETHRRFVLDGLAAAVLPDLAVAEERRRGIVLALEGPALYRDIFFYKRKGKPLPKAVDGFLAALGRAIKASAARN